MSKFSFLVVHVVTSLILYSLLSFYAVCVHFQLLVLSFCLSLSRGWVGSNVHSHRDHAQKHWPLPHFAAMMMRTVMHDDVAADDHDDGDDEERHDGVA